MRALFARIAGALLAAVALAAQAGGPLGVCSTTGMVANNAGVKYPGAGTVTLNYDRGNLGPRTSAQAAAIVNSAIALWTNVSTATITIARGADMPVDITSANINTTPYYASMSDGLNPVIYDTDGTITDMIFGANAHSNVLGFAGSGWSGSTCQYVEGRAVINGAFPASDTLFATVIAHEIGHLIGLDHTQLDNVQGIASGNYPLMYPIAYRNTVSLHEDDVAAITALYPDTNVNSVYGTLTGTFVTAAGAPVPGANIWAQTATGQTFSVVSDYLAQGNGYFKLLLPPGTYTLHAEAIDKSFSEGSGVGPYSNDDTDVSFQAPLYDAGGNPMPAVTMTPTITMTAGCNASVTFRINGTSTMGTTCAPPATPSVMSSPIAGSTLAGSSVIFTWTAGTGTITERYLTVGTTLGGSEIYGAYQGTSTARTVTGIPTNGAPIYVQLSSFIAGAWQTLRYTYTAATAVVPAKSAMTSPTPGSTLAGASVTFNWDAGTSVTARFLSVGSTVGGSQYYGADQGTALSRTVSGLPTDGSAVYVRLTSTIGGVAQNTDYTYNGYLLQVMSTMTSPLSGTTLASSSITFNWNAGTGISARYLMVGTTAGGSEIYGAYQDSLSRTVTGIPQDGRTVYVRLMSYTANGWANADYMYTGGTAPAAVASVVTTPAPGSTLAGASATFNWTAGTGLTARYLTVGTTPNGSEVYAAYQAVAATSASVSGLPTNGSTLYVRLYSYINGGWQINSYTYTAANSAPAAVASVMSSPAPGSTLPGASATFSWTAGSGLTARYLTVGTTLTGSEIYAAYQNVAATSATLTGLPTNAITLYVRLYSYINGGWQINSYSYTAANAAGAAVASVMTSPTPGSTLSGSSATFAWDAGSGLTARYFTVGTTPGGSEIYAGYQDVAATSKMVTGLPASGAVIYVRLYSFINGNWQINNYSYTSGP